jgi:hypothetical protein
MIKVLGSPRVTRELSGSVFSQQDAWQTWRLLNRTCFNNKLNPPLFILFENGLNHLVNPDHKRPAEPGGPAAYTDFDPDTEKEVILIADDIEDPALFMATMGHEMVHQSLSQRLGYVGMLKAGHGPLFVAELQKLKRMKGLKLIHETI